ncbi:MAG: T9SS type A sorting domain-containing protein [Candidatus Stahlbacteria bacterium]|nr:T9SS type A sorting domain-containing protein [Candidatus Stahlbacteria bacterium]
MTFLLFCILGNWSADSVISEGYTSYSNQHNIVCMDNGDVHAIWYKWHQYSDDYSLWSAYYSGTNWTLPQQVSPSSYILVGHPSLATFQDNLYAVWESGREYSAIVLRCFINGNWEDSVISISWGTQCSYAPSLACDKQGVVHIVYEKGYEIHYMNLFGSTLSGDTVLSNSNVYAAYPCISAFDNSLYVVWVDLRDGNFELYFKKFNGHEWSDDIRVTNSSNASIFPSLCVDSLGVPNIVWQEDSDDGFQLFYTTYKQNSYFTVPTLLVDSPGDAISPSITSCGTDIHLSWSDSRSGDWEIYYKTIGGEDIRLTNSPGVSANPSICASANGNLYLLFWDTRVLPSKVYFKECVSSKQNANTPSTLIVSPNPFTQQTVIELKSLGVKELQLQIYDLAGRLVRNFLIPNPQSPIPNIAWDGCDSQGRRLNSGIYFVVFNDIASVKSSVGDEKIVKKVILLK